MMPYRALQAAPGQFAPPTYLVIRSGHDYSSRAGDRVIESSPHLRAADLITCWNRSRPNAIHSVRAPSISERLNHAMRVGVIDDGDTRSRATLVGREREATAR